MFCTKLLGSASHSQGFLFDISIDCLHNRRRSIPHSSVFKVQTARINYGKTERVVNGKTKENAIFFYTIFGIAFVMWVWKG
jgi:hypothetical protein